MDKTDTITKTFGAGTAVFTDDCADMTNWTATGQWDFTSEEFVTPSTSITDSPGSNYQNNVSSDIELNQSFSFENATYAYIQFQAMWEIENDWDFVQFMASLDGGISWTPLCGKYTNPGSSDQDFENPLYDNFQSNWVLEEIDLTNYIGETDVRFRFYFYSDGGVTEEGFYFDDFAVYTDHINDASLSEFETSTVSVFPNPASNLVTLQFSNLNALSTVEIYNELGALVTTIQPQQNVTQLNIQNWAEGVYFVKTVSSANEVLMTRFVIVR
ncbi:MAG: immune inhibitor A [Crocinitomicaceae bacterium]|nr:immune inhibitor A [Crocinitomicaceae bacterium]